MLRSAGAHDTYLRTYRGALDAQRVLEFMLLDRLFPRSVFYALNEAERSLDQLDHQPNSRVGARAEAQRLLGRARSELEFLRPGEILDDLQERLLSLQETCRELGDAISKQYFHAAPWVAWTDAGSGTFEDQLEGEL